MQTMSGGRNSIGGGVRKEDDGGGADIPVTAEGAGRVRGMWEGDGGGVAGIPPDDTAQTGKGNAVKPLEVNREHIGWTY